LGGRHGATRRVSKALKNMARVQRRPSGQLKTYLAQERTGLRPTPYSKFALPGQSVKISQFRNGGALSALSVEHAIKLHRKLAKGPDFKHRFIPQPGKIGKATRAYKK